MMQIHRPLAAVLVLLILGGCASNRYCVGEQDYEKAQTLPPLKSVEGLRLPETAAALRIPPPPAVQVPFGTEDADGNGVCLDRPPPLAAPPAAEKRAS